MISAQPNTPMSSIFTTRQSIGFVASRKVVIDQPISACSDDSMTPEDEAIRNALARILTFFGVEFADASRALVFKIGAETINFPYGSAIADNSKIVEKLADVLKLHQRVPPPPQPEIRKEPDVVPVVSEPVFRPEDPPTEEEP